MFHAERAYAKFADGRQINSILFKDLQNSAGTLHHDQPLETLCDQVFVCHRVPGNANSETGGIAK